MGMKGRGLVLSGGSSRTLVELEYTQKMSALEVFAKTSVRMKHPAESMVQVTPCFKVFKSQFDSNFVSRLASSTENSQNQHYSYPKCEEKKH